jgi:IclR family transcriptional regulator, acetate operon repressor
VLTPRYQSWSALRKTCVIRNDLAANESRAGGLATLVAMQSSPADGASPTAGSPSAGTVQSVDRAVRVLEILAERGETGVSEIARELGVHASTASRLVGALLVHELVEQPARGGKYRLGVGVLRLAGATAGQLDLSTQAQPVCDGLAAELDATTNVAIASAGVAINVCQAQPSTAVATQNWVGQRTVLHATSSGKVLLAYMRDDERDDLLQGPLTRFTPHTLTSAAALLGELRTVEETGCARALEEYEEGLNAVAAPVRAHDGTVVAAISASGPAYRLPRERIDQACEAVVRAGAEVSRRMGYHGDIRADTRASRPVV